VHNYEPREFRKGGVKKKDRKAPNPSEEKEPKGEAPEKKPPPKYVLYSTP